MRNSLLLLSLLLLPVTAGRAETLTFAPMPMSSPEAVVSQFLPMLQYLGKEIGAEFRIDYPESNTVIIERFREGKIDLAFLGPLPYIELKKLHPEAQPLVFFNDSSGQPFYTCSLVAGAENRLSPGALRGRRIALTQPFSTCGYLAVESLLRKAGSSLEKNRFRYLGPHDEVALAVVRGEFEAGGVKTSTARKYLPLGLEIIAESPPLPAFALIANGMTLSPERIDAICKALCRLKPLIDPNARATVASWGAELRHRFRFGL